MSAQLCIINDMHQGCCEWQETKGCQLHGGIYLEELTMITEEPSIMIPGPV
jgi:hypothetical protein